MSHIVLWRMPINICIQYEQNISFILGIIFYISILTSNNCNALFPIVNHLIEYLIDWLVMHFANVCVFCNFIFIYTAGIKFFLERRVEGNAILMFSFYVATSLFLFSFIEVFPDIEQRVSDALNFAKLKYLRLR